MVLPPVEDAKYAVIALPPKVNTAGCPAPFTAELTASRQESLSLE